MTAEHLLVLLSTYWNQGYGYQQGYGPGYGSSNDSPHGYYGYGPGYYYSPEDPFQKFQMEFTKKSKVAKTNMWQVTKSLDLGNFAIF
ncbi:Metastasis-Associated Protein Mta1 [Manis pentadactyla]|nr:Metastasis-Associated Protein Mta1 [Manis pentadactyla]